MNFNSFSSQKHRDREKDKYSMKLPCYLMYSNATYYVCYNGTINKIIYTNYCRQL